MQLSSTLAWLVDAAGDMPGADRRLAELGAHWSDGVRLAGGALTLSVPHPLIARRTWLWRAGNGEVIEALGFVAGGLDGLRMQRVPPAMPGGAGSPSLASGPVHEDMVGSRPDGPLLGWIGPRPFTLAKPMRCARPRALPRRRSPPLPRAPR